MLEREDRELRRAEMIAYIDRNKDCYGVEPICRVLPIAPSTYHDAHSRPASARAVRDSKLRAEIARVQAGHFGVDRARKVWRQLHREGIAVARCTVERLLGELGLQGVRRGKAGGLPPLMRPPPDPPTRWSGTSRQPGRTSCGSPTSSATRCFLTVR
jgi:transposase InsO family protein